MSKINDLYGNLTRDVDLRYSQAGNPWAVFTVAETNKDRDGNAKPTTFWPVKCFGEQAEKVADLRKGQRVKVEGRIETEEWMADVGEKRSRIVVIAWPRGGISVEDRPDAQDQRAPRGGSQGDPWAIDAGEAPF